MVAGNSRTSCLFVHKAMQTTEMLVALNNMNNLSDTFGAIGRRNNINMRGYWPCDNYLETYNPPTYTAVNPQSLIAFLSMIQTV